MKADLVILGNAIFDSVKDSPFEGGIVVINNRIAFVGPKDKAREFIGPDTEVREYEDNLIMPGICDSHGHFVSAALDYALNICDLNSGNSEEECAQLMADFVAANPGEEKYLGRGWNMSYWGEDPQLPTNKSLDKLIPDVPVFLFSSDLHSTWTNTKGMEYSGLYDFYEEYDEEVIPRGSDRKPIGILREDPSFRVRLDAFAHSEEENAEFQDLLLKAFAEEGITAFADVSPMPPERMLREFKHMKDLDEKGEMTIRLYLHPGSAPPITGSEMDKAQQLLAYYNTDKMRVAGAKAIYDGVTASYTALMTEPYHDNPTTNGKQYAPYEQLREWVIESNRLGFGARIHCIGDLAVKHALDAFELSNRMNDNSKIHNAVEHIEIIRPEDIPRFGELGVVASMQPGHQMKDKGIKLQRCGRERSKYEWAFRSIKDAGAHICFGTDYTAMDFKPFPNIYYAMTIKDLDGTQYGEMSRREVLTLPECLKAYTIEGAYMHRMDDRLGTLEPGKYADIIVTDRNLFNIPVDNIKDTKVLLTVFDGKIIYEK